MGTDRGMSRKKLKAVCWSLCHPLTARCTRCMLRCYLKAANKKIMQLPDLHLCQDCLSSVSYLFITNLPKMSLLQFTFKCRRYPFCTMENVMNLPFNWLNRFNRLISRLLHCCCKKYRKVTMVRVAKFFLNSSQLAYTVQKVRMKILK